MKVWDRMKARQSAELYTTEDNFFLQDNQSLTRSKVNR